MFYVCPLSRGIRARGIYPPWAGLECYGTSADCLTTSPHNC